MHIPKIKYSLFLLLSFFILVSQEKMYSQIVIGTPNLGFSQACANSSFNTYSTTFVFSPETGLEASNQFSIEYQTIPVIFLMHLHYLHPMLEVLQLHQQH